VTSDHAGQPAIGLPPQVREAVQTAREAVEAWADAYEASTFLQDAGVVIRPTPTVSHDVLAQRAIDRTRPFNEHGGGYRDTLHWYTVLDVIAIDWAGDDATDGSKEELDVTAWDTDTDGKFTVDTDRTDLQPAPIYTSSLSFLDPTVVRGLTSSVFAGWKSEQFRTSVALGAELVKGSKIKWTMPVSNLGAEVAKRGFTAGLDLNSLGAAISRGSLFGDAAAWSSLSGG
jgi:hypothetical protein